MTDKLADMLVQHTIERGDSPGILADREHGASACRRDGSVIITDAKRKLAGALLEAAVSGRHVSVHQAQIELTEKVTDAIDALICVYLEARGER